MKIYLRTLEEERLAFQVQAQETIQTLKRKYHGCYNFFYQGQNLQDEQTISHYHIQNRSIISVLPRIRGGRFATITFNKMVDSITGQFSQTAPEWRVIDFGLNLQGVFMNSKCKAKGQKAWIHKGIGKFHMNMEVYKSKCPICHQFSQKVQNMGLYQAKCISTGRIMGEQKEMVQKFEHADQHGFLTFEDKDETKAAWLYLVLEITSL